MKYLWCRGLALGASVFLLSACGEQLSQTKIEKDNPIPSVPGSCANGSTSASVSIFNENPRTSSGDPNLPFATNLSSSYTVASTLTGLDGTCLLQNERYSITADTLFSSNIANVNPANNSLVYSPSQPEFQQVNSFYYSTLLKLLLSGLGADLTSMGKVAIDAHCNVSNNAYYSPTSKKLCFGYSTVSGSKKVWAADDGDVVVHETGHTINHTLASTSIMNSTGEAGAIDESLADYWALTVMNDPELSEWFLGSVSSSLIRDATQVFFYPDSMVYEVHDDSRVLTQVLWDLRKPANLGKTTTDALVKRALQLLPATTRFKDFYQAIYDASGPTFLGLSNAQRSLIVSKFTARGLHRADSATGLRLSTNGSNKQIYVIDDHELSFQSGGNCNGALDVGETVLVLVNLENPSPGKMGMGVATINSAPSGITIPSGGNIGEYYKFNGSSDFVSSLPISGSNRDDATLMAGFLFTATSSGVKNFTLSYVPMYSDPTGVMAAGSSVNVNFSLTVGSVATKTSCTDSTLWP